MPSSPTLYRRARRQQGGTGSPKHPSSVNPDPGERNHPPNRNQPRFPLPTPGRSPRNAHSDSERLRETASGPEAGFAALRGDSFVRQQNWTSGLRSENSTPMPGTRLPDLIATQPGPVFRSCATKSLVVAPRWTNRLPTRPIPGNSTDPHHAAVRAIGCRRNKASNRKAGRTNRT